MGALNRFLMLLIKTRANGSFELAVNGKFSQEYRKTCKKLSLADLETKKTKKSHDNI